MVTANDPRVQKLLSFESMTREDLAVLVVTGTDQLEQLRANAPQPEDERESTEEGVNEERERRKEAERRLFVLDDEWEAHCAVATRQAREDERAKVLSEVELAAAKRGLQEACAEFLVALGESAGQEP
jgi:protein-disulfide isomerase-like protein with CxxC motif